MGEGLGLAPVPFETRMFYLRQNSDRISLKDDDPYLEQKSQLLADINCALGIAEKSHTEKKIASVEMGREGFQPVEREIIEDGLGNNIASLVYLRMCKIVLGLAAQKSGIHTEAVVVASAVNNKTTFGESDIDVLTSLPRFGKDAPKYKAALGEVIMSFRQEFSRFMPLMVKPYHVGIHLDPLPPAQREKARGLKIDEVPNSLEEMARVNFIESKKGEFVGAPEKPKT